MLQEALARQRAMSAVSSSQVSADPIPRSASPWDSAWDQQSAAARGLSSDHYRQPQRHRGTNQGAFGSIVSDYRPASQLPATQTRGADIRSHRYGNS